MRWKRTVILSLYLAVALALVATLSADPSPRLRRYVSLPRPDGTRYTFLYPERLQLRMNASGDLYGARKLSPAGFLCDCVSDPVSCIGYSPVQCGEAVRVHIGQYGRPVDPGWTRGPMAKECGLDRHRYYQAVYHHPRTHERIGLTYSWQYGEARWCQPLTARIIGSFQILQAGEEPPVDPAP